MDRQPQAGSAPAEVIEALGIAHRLKPALGGKVGVLVAAPAVSLKFLVNPRQLPCGFGVQPPAPSWGNILTEGKNTLGVAWWLSFYPGLAILLSVLGYNLLGEGLRDALDPRLK